MIKKIILSIILFSVINVYSQQKSINNYKYVIVPTQFGWLKKADQYQVNSLTNFLFKKYGFTTFLSDEQFPEDLSNNRCLALTANVKKNSGVFKTRNTIELKDCSNNVIFSSIEGVSRNKDLQKGYHEAIRKAFVSVQNLNYNYRPIKEDPVIKDVLPAIVNPGVKVVSEKVIELKEVAKDIEEKKVLYAQKTNKGFQLVNTKPAIVFQILKSSKKDFFFIKNLDGVFFKNGNNWIAEYYENEQLVQKTYQIKF